MFLRLQRSLVLTTVVLSVTAASPPLAFDWEPVGMDGVQTTCIEADNRHDRILVGTHEGFWILDLTTDQWTEFDDEGSIGRQVHAIQPVWHDSHRLLTGRENAFFKGYLELSRDGGASSDVVHMSQGGAFRDIEQVQSSFFSCNISDISPGELLRSVDGGETWVPVTGHGHTAMTAVAGGESGGIHIGVAGDDQVWYSDDLGATWQHAGAGLGTGLVHCLVDYNGAGDVVTLPFLAGTDAGLYRKVFLSAPVDWEPVLAGEAVRRVAVAWGPAPWPLGRVNRFAVVTMDGRVLMADGEGGNWLDETGNLPAPAVDVAFSEVTFDLYVATAGGGVHRFHPVVSTVDDLPATVGVAIAAAPNPFNPRTTLRLQVPRTGPARLTVHDLAGRRVAVLHQGPLTAGAHAVDWDAGGQASGIYLARLTTSAGTATVRLVLVR